MSDYDKIVIEPFDTSKAPLPDQKEKWYGTLKTALAGYTGYFMEAFQPELKAKADVQQSSSAPKSAKTLIIRGEVQTSIQALAPGVTSADSVPARHRPK